MNKFLKGCLACAGICIPLGIILVVIGVFSGARSGFYINANGHFSFKSLEDFNFMRMNYDNIKNLKINVDNAKIIFRESDNGEVGLEMNLKSVGNKPHIRVEGNTLYVEKENTFAISLWNFDFGSIFDENANTVTIYVPKSYEFDKVELDTSNGSLEVQDARIKDLYLHTSNGSITLDNIESAGKVEVRTSNGAINCSGTFGSHVELKTSNGKINAVGTYSGGIYAKTSNGKIIFSTRNSEEKYNVDADTSNGSVYVNDTKYGDEYVKNRKASETLEFKSSNGSIELDFSN